MLEILETVNKWLHEDRKIALATVVQTWGSAPRGVGSKMAFDGDMALIGSVSGGCVEGAVIEEGIAGLKDGKPRLLNFGVADDTAWEVGLTCGGKISVYVEPLDVAWWQTVKPYVESDQAVTTVTIMNGEFAGTKVVIDSDAVVQYQTSGIPDATLYELVEIAKQHQTSQTVTDGETRIMVDIYAPRPHLILVGGVHVAMPLRVFAHELGFRVSIVDPRSAFASEERFPDVSAISHDYPDKALPELGLDRNTYLAMLTHDPKIDDPALITALNANVAYIGVLSSSRTHEKRVKRLKDGGITDAQLARIHTPIGLDIGSRTPEEIALAVMAEIIAVRNGKA